METTRSTPTARKKHHCEVCGWNIEPGDKYERVVTFDGGDVLTWKAHLEPCAEAAQLAWNADYYDYANGLCTGGDVREWASETAKHDPYSSPEAVEIRRRLQINEERWREKRAAEIREAERDGES